MTILNIIATIIAGAFAFWCGIIAVGYFKEKNTLAGLFFLAISLLIALGTLNFWVPFL